MPFLDNRQNRRFKKALRKAGICLRRATLYEDQLEWAKNQLEAFAASNAGHAAALAAGGRQWKARLQAHRQARNLNMAYSVFQPAFSRDQLVKLIVNLDRDETGMIVVECPAIPGCVSQGKTEAEALANIREAIEACLEARAANGMPLTVATREIEVKA